MKIIQLLILTIAVLLFQSCATSPAPQPATNRPTPGSMSGTLTVKAEKIDGKIVITPVNPADAMLPERLETVIKEFVEDFDLLKNRQSITFEVLREGDNVKFKPFDQKFTDPD